MIPQKPPEQTVKRGIVQVMSSDISLELLVAAVDSPSVRKRSLEMGRSYSQRSGFAVVSVIPVYEQCRGK